MALELAFSLNHNRYCLSYPQKTIQRRNSQDQAPLEEGPVTTHGRQRGGSETDPSPNRGGIRIPEFVAAFSGMARYDRRNLLAAHQPAKRES